MPLPNVWWLSQYRIPVGIMAVWAGTAASIPAGFTRETSLDTRYVKMVVNGSTDPGGTGGSTTHDHPFPVHTHTGAAHTHVGPGTGSKLSDGTDNVTSVNNNGGMPNTHAHGTSATSSATATTANSSTPTNFDTATSNSPWYEMIFIKSDGSPVGFPANAITFYNGAAPSGWTAHAGSANRFWKGAAAAGNGGSTGGTGDAHGHTSATHDHASGGTHTHGASPTDTSGVGDIDGPAGPAGVHCAIHTHTVTGNTGTGAPTYQTVVASTTSNGDVAPPWFKLLPIENTSGAGKTTVGVIGMWTGTLATVPNRWKICDGNNGTPNVLDKYVLGAANSGEVGNTGGATTHTHTTGANHVHAMNTHSHTMPANTDTYVGVNTNFSGAASRSFVNSHSHSIGGSTNTDGSGNSGGTAAAATANSSNDPVHTRIAYVQFVG